MPFKKGVQYCCCVTSGCADAQLRRIRPGVVTMENRLLTALAIVVGVFDVVAAFLSLSEKSPCLFIIMLLISAVIGLGYVAFARKGTAFGANVKVARFSRMYRWARVSLGVLGLVIIGLLAWGSSRSCLLNLCRGAPSPTPTVVVTPSPTLGLTPGSGGIGVECCKHCDPAKSKPCGDGCISLGKTCNQPPGCACSP